MTVYVEAGTAAAKLAWQNRSLLKNLGKDLFRLVKQGRINILVFGAGGVGKSTVGKLVAGRLTDEELLKGYRRSYSVEDMRMRGTLVGRMLIAPGQRPIDYHLPEIVPLLTAGNIHGIVNVGAYGYHSLTGTGAYSEHSLFEDGMTKSEFVRTYLTFRREAECEQLSQLAPHIAAAPNKLWFLTLVTKQDLWWHERVAVRDFYQTAVYSGIINGIEAKKGPANFRHDVVSAALTWENLEDDNREVLAPTTSGYDHQTKIANLGRFAEALAQLTGIQA